MFSFVQEWLFQRAVKRLKRRSDNRQALPWTKVKRIGLLCNAATPETRKAAGKIAELLKGPKKQVQVLGYFPGKIEEPELFEFPVFSRKELDMAGRPKGQTVNYFLQQPMDLLVCLEKPIPLPLQFLLRVCPKVLRAGFYQETGEEVLDLMVEEDGAEAAVHAIIEILKKVDES